MTTIESAAKWTVCSLILAALGAAPAWAAEAQKAESSAVDVKAGALAANPDKYVGKQVKVRSDVATVFGSRMFTLDEDRIGASPDVLVLVPEHAAVDSGNTVTVTGTVRKFVWNELRREYDWFDLRPQFDVVYRSRPVVVATSVKHSNNAELVGQAQQPEIDEITRQPGDYYGDFVSVRAPVGEIESPHVFTLDRGAGRPEVLVLIPDPQTGATVKQKSDVTVRGVVRPFFVADLQRDYDWFGLDQDLAVQLEDKPVIVAESVRNTAGKEFVEDAGERGDEAGAAKPTASR